jgi:diaminopimelate epimerase|uniref:diaminopimelate epimerase n=1 Tax=Cephaloticoccus sp. TaxID=1985742 RepID=UPI004048FCFA
MKFFKYHALGNDYIVLNPAHFPAWKEPSVDQIKLICDRNFGIGSDGILWGPGPTEGSDYGLRIFNPDGSEAEKSGNGLRIFSRFLLDEGLVAKDIFTIQTLGGSVTTTIKEEGHLITVAMGKVSFTSNTIPVSGPEREVIDEKIVVLNRTFYFSAASIGNPHCVLPVEDISPALAHRYGPIIESHLNFPNRTNVQFLKVLDRSNIQIEIWERGAGYTLASGSSSSASAAVAHKLGLVDNSVTVHMPGGAIAIEITDDYFITMTGTVNKVAEGLMHKDLFDVNIQPKFSA